VAPGENFCFSYSPWFLIERDNSPHRRANARLDYPPCKALEEAHGSALDVNQKLGFREK
jgi:hypothetical protein